MDLIDVNRLHRLPPPAALALIWRRRLGAATCLLIAGLSSSCGGGGSPVQTTVPPAPPAPTVTTVTPANNATGVAVGTTVSVVFSESMLASTISASTVQLAGPSGAIASAVTYNSSNNSATLTPNAALAAGTAYTLTVTTGVQSSSNVALAQAFTSTFKTAASGGGSPAPTVASVTPANNATGVAVGTTVSVVFNESMLASTISASTVQLAGPSGAIASAVTYNSSNNSATLTPNAALAAGTAYTLTVTTGVQSSSNVALAQAFTSTFKTAASGGGSPAPTVASVTPANNATGVAVGTTVSVVFSESMLASTISASTVQLAGPSGTIASAVTYSSVNDSAILTPNAALAAGTAYTLTVTTGVQSSANVALARAFTSTFTTQSSGSTAVPPQFQNLLTSYDVIPSLAIALPGVYQDTGDVWVQPTFNTTVKRIGVSNAVLADHPASTSEYPFYSKEQSWSTDNQYMAVWAIDGWIQILDGGKGMNGHKPYQYLFSLGANTFGCDPDPEVRWSNDPRTPHLFYHICNNMFYVYNVDTQTDKLLVDWNVKIPGHSFTYVYGPAEGNPSTAYNAQCDCYDRYWAWGSQTTATQPSFYSIIVYDRYLDKGGVSTGNYPADNSGVIANVLDSTLNVCPGGSSDIDWVSMSPNGDYVLIDYGDTDSAQTSHEGCGIGVYTPTGPTTLAWQRQLFTTDYHSDIGYDAAGNEVVVSLYDDSTAYTPQSNICMIRSARISDGQVTRMQLWGNDSHGVLQNWCFGATTGPPGFHVSMRGTVNQSLGLKGYALLSLYEDNLTPIATQDTHLFNMEQLVLYVPGDGSTAQAKIWRLGKTQSIRVNYNDEPHCVASPDFHRTLCGTNWRNFSTEEPVYPMVTELP